MARSTCVIRGIPIPKSTTRRPRQTTRLLLPVDFQKIGDFRITVKENSVLSIFYSVAAVSSSLRAVFSARANIQSFLLFIKCLGKKKNRRLRVCFELSNFGNFWQLVRKLSICCHTICRLQLCCLDRVHAPLASWVCPLPALLRALWRGFVKFTERVPLLTINELAVKIRSVRSIWTAPQKLDIKIKQNVTKNSNYWGAVCSGNGSQKWMFCMVYRSEIWNGYTNFETVYIQVWSPRI